MDPTEQNDEIVRRLFHKSLDLKLSTDTVFLIGPSDNLDEFTGAQLIELVQAEAFSKIFSGSSDECEDIDEIQVSDLQPDTFLNLLKFIYKNEMIRDLTDIYPTYEAADRYVLTKLTKELLQFCKDSLTIENSTLIYDQYLQINDLTRSDLERVMDVIAPHAFLAFQSPQFLLISKETLIELLNSDKLLISEKDLYLRCLCWLDVELENEGFEKTPANRQNLFNELKHLIRFPTMSKKQFFDKKSDVSPVKSGLFTKSELKEFETYYKTGEEKALSVNYKTYPRTALEVGKLTFDQAKKRFEMNVDEILDKENDCSLLNFVDYGGYFSGLTEMDDQTRRVSKTQTGKSGAGRKSKGRLSLTNNSLTNNNVESVRLFRIQCDCSAEDAEQLMAHGYHPSILEDGECMNIKFRSYLVDGSNCYFDIYPHVELKKDHKYCFEFFTHDNRYAQTTFKLASVYKVKKEVLSMDIKLKLVGSADWALPKTLYVLY